MASKKRVTYFYDDLVGSYNFGYGHPMKPFRMKMAHSLITAYGLDKYMEVIRPVPASDLEMTRFHSDDYIEYLKRASPEFAERHPVHTLRYLPGEDCPPFDGIYEFCTLSAGGSICGAQRLNQGEADIVVNWSGGLHHAKKSEASGFCYVNDINLAILELLKYHQRVLYLDIDVHHGDGVEEAFYSNNRVMSVSFHKFGDFFPGTGDIRDIGIGKGKYHSINVPLRDGIDDESYQYIFRPVMTKVMQTFRPGAIVMQCGTDSLSGDRLGCFNLSMAGHASCVEFMKRFNVPLICVGGGGYSIRNVSRTWAYETSVLLEKKVSPMLPYTDYYDFYGPEYVLDVPSCNMDNLNSRAYLDNLITIIYQYLNSIEIAPSAHSSFLMNDPCQTDAFAEYQQNPLCPWPGAEAEKARDDLESDLNADNRADASTRFQDKHVARYTELATDNVNPAVDSTQVSASENGASKKDGRAAATVEAT